MRLVFSTFLLIFLFGFVRSAAIGLGEINSILTDIPDEEKPEFIKTQLLLGYLFDTHAEKLAKYNLSEESVMKIYNYFKSHHLIEDEATLLNLKNTVCFPNGECIDTDDPGVYPI